MDGNPTKYFWAEPDGGAGPRSPTSSSAATASRRNCGTPSAAACAPSWRGRRRSRPLTGAATPASWVCTISVSANFIASISGRPPRPIRELPTSINSIRSTASSPSRPPFSGAQGTSTLWTPILNGPTSSPMSLSWAPISSQRPLSKTGVRPEKGLFLLYAGSVWGILGPKELQRILS